MKTDEDKEVKTWFNLKVYWSFLRKYKLIFILLTFAVLAHEAKQIADKYIVKMAFDKSAEYISGAIAKGVLLDYLFVLLLVLLGLTLVISVFGNWLRLHLVNKLETNLIYDLKNRYFSHIISLDHKFYTTHKTGSLISRIGRGGGAMERITDSIFFEFAPLIIQFSILTFSLIYLDTVSAIIVSIIVVVFIIFSLIIQKIANKYNLAANKAEDIEKGNIADIFTNVDSIKYFGKEFWIRKRYLNLADETRKTALRSWNMWRIVSAGQSLILGVGTVALLYFSFNSFLKGELSLGTLTFIYTTYYSLMGPLFGFIHGVRGFTRSLTDFQDLFQYGTIESDIKDKSGAHEIKINKGEIEFDNISFAYEKRSVFNNFSLNVPANKKIALVGHSGCGKSSLVKLLYRLYDIQSGSIKIDGKDIRDVKHESLRSEMAIVPQECILFDDTVFNNIKFSNPHATREQVMQAIKFAQLDKIVNRFPKKENTIVGERGVKLSGGEKQRVSIARAILADKKILVLDEATSALDSETEHEIQRDLQRLMEGRTSIVIAHRLSTIMNADIIVVMKEGEIVQMGKHNELIRKSGEYKKLWELQKGGYLKE
jgi:ABC-type multidrug transport system fused ATPase/permease subunit